MVKPSKAKPDTVPDLVAKLNAAITDLCENGTEVSVSVQRVPQPFWRYLRPILKVSMKPGRPL